jgi:hypothetical protein
MKIGNVWRRNMADGFRGAMIGNVGKRLGLLAAVLFATVARGEPAPAGPLMAVDYAALVSRANLDLKRQLDAAGRFGSMPIGNGRLGTLLWTGVDAPQSGLHLQLNHTDVFQFRNSSQAPNDTHHANCNGCGGVDIDFGGGVFGEATTRNQLDLHDAVATVSGEGVQVRALAWHRRDVIALEITDDRPEPQPIAVSLRPLRPRVQVTGPHTATSVPGVDGGDIELTQAFEEKGPLPGNLDMNAFTALRARVIGRPSTAANVGEDGVQVVAAAGRGSFVVLLAVAQSIEKPMEQVRTEARTALDAAAALGFAKLLGENQAYWRDFWSRSFICISGAPEAEPLMQFYIWGTYIAGCCMRGNYPPKHNGLIFITQDNRTWGAPFWWYNESAQQGWQYTANRPELQEPVFRWIWSNRTAYANAAERSWNSRGWYIPETSNWDGPEILPEGVYRPQGFRLLALLSSMGGGYTARNTYNMARFTALFYQKYLYTGDEAWLKEKVYPLARDTAEFYCGLKAGFQHAGGVDYGPEGQVILRKDADGKYHLYGTMLHEHIWYGKDIIEDLAAIRGIFPVAIALSKKFDVDAEKRVEWQEVLDNLAPYPMSDQPGSVGGLGPGTWAQSLSPHGNIRDNMEDESPRMGPVVGAFLDVLTLESDNPKDWTDAMATLNQHPGTVKGLKYECGYYPILPARMGRPDLVEKTLPALIARTAERTPGGTRPYGSMQGNGVFANAVQQALLLSIAPTPISHPVIRVMDGWPRAWDVSFQLLAKGGFLVSSAMKNETIPFVQILSQQGGECRIRNPWPGTEVALYRNGRKQMTSKDALLVFQTRKGRHYVLVPADGERPDDLKMVIPAPVTAQAE